jgi:putative ABC transport system permease protein
MKMIDLISRAGRSLRSAKVRTVLTSLAIAVGAFTLTATLAAGNGIRAYTDRLVANNFDPAELIVGRDAEVENSGAPNSSPKEYDESVANLTVGGDGSSLQIKQITSEDIAELGTYDFVEQVRPNYQVSVRYIETDASKKRYTLSVRSYNPGQKPELEAGTLPASGDIAEGTVLLPIDYVKLLGFSSARHAIGKQVRIVAPQPFTEGALQAYLETVQSGAQLPGQVPTDTPPVQDKTIALKIIAVTKKGAASLDFAGLPVMLSDSDTSALYDFTTKDTQNYGKYTYAYVRVKEGEDQSKAEAAKQALKADGYYVQTSQDIQKTITQFVDILQILVGVFGVITVIASVFGIINTMYISVLERTREIGLMKALGMRGHDVAWLFRIEAAWIGFLGGVIGSLLAYGIGTALNPWLTETLGLGAGNSILIFDGLQIAVLIAALIAVAIIAGWLPARKAARLDPIEALRTE